MKSVNESSNKGSYTHIDNLLAKVPEVPADTIVSRSIYGDEGLKSTLFAFAPGQELSEHTAAWPAILHFLSGEADLVLGSDRLEAHPGTWVHMPAHLPHSIMARTQVVMLLLLLS